MTIAIADVCTDGDLADEIGGPAQLAELIPDDWDGSAEQARQKALNDVLAALASRKPPIFSSSLYDVTELNRPVVYGALTRLYRFAKTSPDDIFASHHKEFSKLYASTLAGLNPTLITGEQAAPLSVAFHRR